MVHNNDRKSRRFLSPLFEIPQSNHPLFRMVRKRIKWAKTHSKAKGHSWRFVGRIVAAALVLWILWTITQDAPVLFGNQIRYFESATRGVYLLFLFSAFLSYVLDVLTIIYIILSFNTEIDDLVRLALDELTIVWAQYDLARLRTWRFYLVMLALRIATLLIVLTIGLYTLVLQYNPLLEENTAPISILALLVIIVTIYLFLEPFWRTKAMTAMGLSMAARRKHTATSVVYAFMVVFGSWILKWGVYGGVSFLFLIGSGITINIVRLVVGPMNVTVLEQIVPLNYIAYFIILIIITRIYYQMVQNSSFAAIRDRFRGYELMDRIGL